ncbi:MAG TPA: pyridoxamine 5'-phosphate oxidase family protein [Candidatus Omnitrophota bacterium]|nr:pyridoxamine 5'-phosphate oxidase family protein [Candidatus Omnitrophota bacterium]
MPKITEKIEQLLEKREFVSVATATRNGVPNTAPKFFFRAKGDYIYLIDYVIGKTITNLKENSLVSVSFMDYESLEAYRLNGKTQLIERGKVFDAILKEWDKKLLKFSTDRVIEAVRTGKKSHHFELEMTERFVVLKIKITDVIKIGRRGDIWKESN